MPSLIALDVARNELLVWQKQQAGIPLTWREQHPLGIWVACYAAVGAMILLIVLVMMVVTPAHNASPNLAKNRVNCEEMGYHWDRATRICS